MWKTKQVKHKKEQRTNTASTKKDENEKKTQMCTCFVAWSALFCTYGILCLTHTRKHSETNSETHWNTRTVKHWGTHTHTHAKRGKSIRNQSTRQGFHSVRKQTVDSRQARPGWGFLVLFGRSFGGGLGWLAFEEPPFFAACGPSSSWKRKCGLIYSTRLLARLFPTAANIFFCTTPAKIFLSP